MPPDTVYDVKYIDPVSLATFLQAKKAKMMLARQTTEVKSNAETDEERRMAAHLSSILAGGKGNPAIMAAGKLLHGPNVMPPPHPWRATLGAGACVAERLRAGCSGRGESVVARIRVDSTVARPCWRCYDVLPCCCLQRRNGVARPACVMPLLWVGAA